MFIKIFTKQGCKDCVWQKKAIKAVFNPNQYEVIDAEDGGDGESQADAYGIQMLPATVVFDDNDNPIIIKEGKITTHDIKKEIIYIQGKN